MAKKYIIFGLCLVIVSLLADALFGRYLTVKISTLPIVKRFNILSPQSPIVINTREVVREEGVQDVQNTIGRVRNKISSVVLITGEEVSVTATALHISADGVFLTTKAAFPTNGAEYKVRLPEGNLVSIESITTDPYSNLVLFKAQASGLSVANLQNSNELNSGETLINFIPGNLPLSTRVQISYISRAVQDTNLQTLEAGYPLTTFDVTGLQNIGTASVMSTLNGDIAGIYDGDKFISSDNIRIVIDSYLANRQQIIRQVFGFSYRPVTEVEIRDKKYPRGVVVVAVDGSSPEKPAKQAGLLAGDIITNWDGSSFNTVPGFEATLQRTQSTKTIKINIQRAGKSQELNFQTRNFTP